MSSGKKIVVQLKVNHGGNPIQVVDSLFENTVAPDLVFLDVSSNEYPHRSMELPWEIVEFAAKNPRVKFMWDGNNPIESDDRYEILLLETDNPLPKEYIESNVDCKSHESIDMTVVSVFYDAGINELRKVATRKAISHWTEQYHLPSEMMFIELGFNGVFTFQEKDFPKEIQYIRIDGNDSNKYLFQKEHLWNMMAKRAKNEKLMFVDSDIAPLEDVDWFKQVHDALDKCLFTQGFRTITYLDKNNAKTDDVKFSYTSRIIEEKKPWKSVPGGVYCISKRLLTLMGYFNYLPFGGGDNLFWSELIGFQNTLPQFVLSARQNIEGSVVELSKLLDKKIFEQVYVDVYHFYHGEKIGRSYQQRHYMAMTQFPLVDRIITEDEQGLLAWIDVNHYFYGVMSNLSMVNNKAENAHELLMDYFDYLPFVDEFKKSDKFFKKASRFQVVRQLHKWISKYSKTRGELK